MGLRTWTWAQCPLGLLSSSSASRTPACGVMKPGRSCESRAESQPGCTECHEVVISTLQGAMPEAQSFGPEGSGRQDGRSWREPEFAPDAATSIRQGRFDCWNYISSSQIVFWKRRVPPEAPPARSKKAFSCEPSFFVLSDLESVPCGPLMPMCSRRSGSRALK